MLTQLRLVTWVHSDANTRNTPVRQEKHIKAQCFRVFVRTTVWVAMVVQPACYSAPKGREHDSPARSRRRSAG